MQSLLLHCDQDGGGELSAQACNRLRGDCPTADQMAVPHTYPSIII